MGSTTLKMRNTFMQLIARSLVVLALAAAPGAALAGASSAPFGYTPDPALRTESVPQLTARVQRGCSATQTRIQNVSTAQVARGCGCYAQRLMRSLDAAEIAAYRATGYFNDSARAKGYAAIDACRLRRPV